MTDSEIHEAIAALKAHGYVCIMIHKDADWAVGGVDHSLEPGIYIAADAATCRRIADDIIKIKDAAA